VDLQEGLDVRNASMADYVERVVSAVRAASEPVGVMGWSMGGLVAMMASRTAPPRRLAVIEPSPPAELQGWHPEVGLQSGTYDPEMAYGPFPAGLAPRRESLRARSERRRGLSVRSIPCPLLVVSGADYPEERGSDVAGFYDAELLEFPQLRHFDLIRDPEVQDAVLSWLQ
jgi:pimeloyl-ACP methyl ester carboxylesterase